MGRDSDMVHREGCRWCGAPLSPGHTGPCPNCGKEGKKIVLEIREGIQLRDRMSGILERRREFLKENPKVKWLLFLISFGEPFLGLFLGRVEGVIIGLLFAAVTWWLGSLAAMRIVEIKRRSLHANIKEDPS